MAFQESDYYKQSRQRYKTEAKNSGLKNVHGCHRASSYGIENMQMQGATAIFSVNLKRILKFNIEKRNPCTSFFKITRSNLKITTKKTQNQLQKK